MTSINLSLEPFNERSFVYFPGHLLKGTVELSLERVKSFRGFYVKVYGEAKAHWTETRTRTTGTGKNRRTTTYTVHYEGLEVFLNSRTYFFGQRGGPSFDVQPGIHRYNFACQLPDQLPYTFDGKHGHIMYYVEAVLDIPWAFDKEIKTQFTVIRHDDLNYYPELRVAQKMEEVKTFCCLFCESGPLLMEVTLPCTGFAKGRIISMKIAFSNRSDVDVLATKIKLMRSIHYTSQTPDVKTRTDTEKMVELMGRGVKGGETIAFEPFLEIPGIMLNSNGRFCRVIRLEYYIQVEGQVDGCHTNPTLQFPITIGSVPIRFDDQITPNSNQIILPSAPTNQIILPSAPNIEEHSKNDLPPSFDEAVKMMPPQNSAFMEQSTSSGVGWNVTVPSAPAGENSKQ